VNIELPKYADQIRPALILVCGYARAGKDTLADGLIAGAAGSASKVPLADPLKRAADQVISDLVGHGIKFPGFGDEAFKVANRALLVELGKTCRSVHQDCFVELALNRAAELIAVGTTAIITDVRYSNELQRCADWAALRGVRLYTLLVYTDGIEAANEEEKTNFDMLLIRSETSSIGWTDRSRWRAGAALDIYRHGRGLASLMLI
jgi:hypothetical protein